MVIAEQGRFQIFALGKLREAFNLDNRPILPLIELPLQPTDADQQEDASHAEQKLIHDRRAADVVSLLRPS